MLSALIDIALKQASTHSGIDHNRDQRIHSDAGEAWLSVSGDKDTIIVLVMKIVYSFQKPGRR